jgi:aminoglycoside phosphotransferase (APT) family kinase protein
MCDDVLADADRFAARLPRATGDVRAALRRHEALLDDVTTPVLVHFDLWNGNILVDGGELSGIVDAERAFWGDPLADLVSLALFGDITQDAGFLDGYAATTYAATGRALSLDGSARTRLAMYRAYLYLIMLTEVVPREYPQARRARTYDSVTPHLEKALAELAKRR